MFLALILDAVAIAGQVIVGRALGAGNAGEARSAARRMIEWAVAAGAAFAVVMLALIDVLPHAFTSDPEVVDRAKEIWPLFALMQPLNGAVFALDGILIGAGDTRFLMWGMLAASLGAFVPIALASLALRPRDRGRLGRPRVAHRGPADHLPAPLPERPLGRRPGRVRARGAAA